MCDNIKQCIVMFLLYIESVWLVTYNHYLFLLEHFDLFLILRIFVHVSCKFII